MKRALILCTFLLTWSAAVAADLEKILSSPFAGELTAGPGGRVAWVVNSLGARNIYVAEPPAYKGRALTHYAGDDGTDIGQLKWLADGTGLVFVRGGDLEHPNSANPNPSNQPAAPEQAVQLVSLADGAVRKLADGHSPVIAGDRVVYIKGGQVWSVDLKPDAKPSSLIAAKGSITETEVSPDASMLAVISSRGDHAFLAVYRFASKELRYLDPSVDTDSSPVWSPDSKSVAFIRTPAASGAIRVGPQRTAKQPWTIRIADVAAGTSRKVFEAQPGPGSRFALDSGGTALMWADGRLVLPWERDGWLHLYSISLDGGEPSLLTPGEFEVESMSLTPDRKSVIFASNQDDTDRRHIWKVAIQPGSRPSRVTTGTGIEWSAAALDGGATVCLRADTKIAARAAAIENGKLRDLAPELVPADYPAASLAEPQPVLISAADGMLIHAQLFLPPSGGPAKRPALVFFHGGSRRQMMLGRHNMYYYSNAYAMNQYLASKGYIVLSVNYRSGIGYGLNFREALNYGAGGGSEYNDVIGAGLYLRGRADVDASRIGLWGGSYGGYLTALGLARGSDLFKAGVDFHGVHDWSKLRRVDADSEIARIAFQSSPMASVDTWRSPVLLIHGDDDRNVPFGESVRLVEALRERKVHVEQLIFPDEIHDFLKHGSWLAGYKALEDFFARMMP